MSSSSKKLKSMYDWCWEIAHESYQVARPAMCLNASTVYLYNNEEASLLYGLYFAFFWQMSSNSGNDYMDWERDHAEEDREFSCSRGRAKTKQRVWWYYMVATIMAGVISYYDHKFGLLYLIIHEFCGHLVYNGIFLGIPVHEVSIVKRYGFPLDVLIAGWIYMPFPHLVAIKSFFPTLTICMWGTTMVWGQLKDYDYEKDSPVKTTATVLGPFLTKLLVSGSGIVMMYLDPRLSVYGLYTCYSCYTWPDTKFGKMSLFMGLNLFLVVCFDSKVDATVKIGTFGMQFMAMIWHYIWPTIYANLVQKYYAVLGVVNRHKPYDPAVWEETDPQILLWKTGPLMGRSGSAIMSLFHLEMAQTSLLGYLVFRAQDTWADVCIGTEDRIRGLGLLPERYRKLTSGGKGVTVPPDDTSSYKWDLSNRERNKLYVDVTVNAHRFDAIFQNLKPAHQKVILDFATELGEGWAELERIQAADKDNSEPVTAELMRKHAEVALDAGAFGLIAASGATVLVEAIKPKSDKVDPIASRAYIAYSDFIWYMNLIATIEDDVKEGVLLDDELRSMMSNGGSIDRDVIERVRHKWTLLGLERLRLSKAFLLHPLLVENWTSRMFILQFTKISIGVCEKYCPVDIDKPKTSASLAILQTFLESLTKGSYEDAAIVAMKRGEELLTKYSTPIKIKSAKL